MNHSKAFRFRLSTVYSKHIPRLLLCKVRNLVKSIEGGGNILERK